MKKNIFFDLYIVLNYISLIIWLILGTSFLIFLILFAYEPPYSNIHDFMTKYCNIVSIIIMSYVCVTSLQFLSIKIAKNLKNYYCKKTKYISFFVYILANSIYFILFENKAILAILLLALSLPLLYNIHE